MPDFLSSHPATPERVRNAQINARQFSGPGGGNRDREAYLAGIDGMLYGEDPSEGYVRGRRFLHPRLGFTFMAPDGFTLDNTPQAVLGIKDGGGQALRLDVVRVPAEQPLTAYLNSGWIENIDGDTVEELTIGGFPAATALARGDQWAFRLFVIRFGSDVYRFIFATKQMTPATDRAFREAVDTFRRMSTAEVDLRQAAAHPHRAGRRRRHRRAPRRPHGDRPQGRAVPHPQRPRPVRPPARGRSGEDRDGVSAFLRVPRPLVMTRRLCRPSSVIGIREQDPGSARDKRGRWPLDCDVRLSRHSAAYEAEQHMNLGFVGLGVMGQGIVPRLIAAGHAVTGWNRSQGQGQAADRKGHGLRGHAARGRGALRDRVLLRHRRRRGALAWRSAMTA